MNVLELINLLNDLPPELEVILQKDSEGNGYSPLEGVDGECIYIKDSTWSGDIYSLDWSADDADMDEKEWKKFKKDNKKVVVLWPNN